MAIKKIAEFAEGFALQNAGAENRARGLHTAVQVSVIDHSTHCNDRRQVHAAQLAKEREQSAQARDSFKLRWGEVMSHE
ncbi:hypothetical protein KIPB_006302, partial [Kipferlia bialata]|eukprot:g6302.t1